jgi:2-iminobutanoate/2-iminopropanoate deaminase
MTTLEQVHSDSAPAAIGPYSQAIKAGPLVFLSGQIPLDPKSMEIVSDDIADAAGGNLSNAAKLTIYLTDLGDFAVVNEIMAGYFSEPYPARATIQVSALPKGSAVEIDAILAL